MTKINFKALQSMTDKERADFVAGYVKDNGEEMALTFQSGVLVNRIIREAVIIPWGVSREDVQALRKALLQACNGADEVLADPAEKAEDKAEEVDEEVVEIATKALETFKNDATVQLTAPQRKAIIRLLTILSSGRPMYGSLDFHNVGVHFRAIKNAILQMKGYLARLGVHVAYYSSSNIIVEAIKPETEEATVVTGEVAQAEEKEVKEEVQTKEAAKSPLEVQIEASEKEVDRLHGIALDLQNKSIQARYDLDNAKGRFNALYGASKLSVEDRARRLFDAACYGNTATEVEQIQINLTSDLGETAWQLLCDDYDHGDLLDEDLKALARIFVNAEVVAAADALLNDLKTLNEKVAAQVIPTIEEQISKHEITLTHMTENPASKTNIRIREEVQATLKDLQKIEAMTTAKRAERLFEYVSAGGANDEHWTRANLTDDLDETLTDMMDDWYSREYLEGEDWDAIRGVFSDEKVVAAALAMLEDY